MTGLAQMLHGISLLPLADLRPVADVAPSSADLWRFLIPGYFFSIAIETPVLLIGLSRPHSFKRRLVAGFWLTACSYPIVVVAMPLVIGFNSPYYIPIAETFAALGEAALFALAFHTPEIKRADRIRDWIAVIAANLCSYLIGTVFTSHGWL